MGKQISVRITQYEEDRKRDREYIDGRFDNINQVLGKVEAKMESVVNGTKNQGERLGKAESKMEVLSKELERYSKGVEDKFEEIKRHNEERVKVYDADRKQDRDLLESKLGTLSERLQGVSCNLSNLTETVKADMAERKEDARDKKKLKNRFWEAVISKAVPLIIGILGTIIAVMFSHPEIWKEVADKLK